MLSGSRGWRSGLQIWWRAENLLSEKSHVSTAGRRRSLSYPTRWCSAPLQQTCAAQNEKLQRLLDGNRWPHFVASLVPGIMPPEIFFWEYTTSAMHGNIAHNETGLQEHLLKPYDHK
jgi:hypothetical protein